MTITSLEYDKFYLCLRLAPGDPPEKIELSFNRLIKIYHPDLCTILSKKEAHEKTIAINAAREALAEYWARQGAAPPSYRQEQEAAKRKQEQLRKQEAERRERERKQRLSDALPAANRIDSLSADVVGFKTFAGGYQAPPLESRTFSPWFPQERTEYIYSELRLRYPAARAGALFTIHGVWHGPSGQIINEYEFPTTLLPGTECIISSGFGRVPAGLFATGQHRIDLFVLGRKIASKTFTVYAERLGVPADIESILAKVASLRFFAALPDGSVPQQRTFASRFASSYGLTLYWQLDLTHPAPGSKRDFTIEAFCYRPNGLLLNRQEVNSYVERDWTSSWRTGKLAGFDSFGNYRVDLLIDGQKIARGDFYVDAPPAPSSSVSVSSVRFFEGGRPHLREWGPAYQFRQAATRWIVWQIEFTRAQAQFQLTVDLELYWYGPSGQLFYQQAIGAVLPPGNLNPGWCVSYGRDLPGSFTAGSYRVDTYQSGRLVRSDSFQIVW
jgi:hypothetical protein